MAIDYSKVQTSDETIRKNTGKGWSEWVEILDAWGGRERPHLEIAKHVHSLGIGEWWAQGVTVEYERLIERRQIGQRSDGTYSGGASKTIPGDPARVLEAFTNESERQQWLQPDTLTLRTASAGKSARFDQFDSPGILAVTCYPGSSGKTSVQVQQEKFPSKADADAFRDTWKPRLAALDRYLKNL